MRKLWWSLLLVPALARSGQQKALQLDKIPLFRGVRLTRTDGTSAYGSIQQVNKQFVSFVSQQSGQCEDVEVAKIESVKPEGPGPSGKFSKGDSVAMAPIAAPFAAAYEVKRLFDRNQAEGFSGQWQSDAAPDGTVTLIEIRGYNVTKTSILGRTGTYQVNGSNLLVSYLAGLDETAREDSIPFHFDCGNLVTGPGHSGISGRKFNQSPRNDSVEEPIVGRWSSHDRTFAAEFHPDGTFRISKVTRSQFAGKLERVNGQFVVTWESPAGGKQEWTVRKAGGQLTAVQDGSSTTYTRSNQH